jgi:ring-1,2-phenylacetyl-CoA epoxidase subunit PaaC
MAGGKEKDFVAQGLFEFLIRLADDHFILGHRLSQWCGHAPMLEEDLALANIALDFIGQARSLYTYAGDIEGNGRDEDDLAFLRKEHEYHNLMLVERPNIDFAHAIVRQLFYSLYSQLQWEALSGSSDEKLAQIAAKARKEAIYHVRHCAEWLIRLGDGTPESAVRVKDAVITMAPHIDEMFDKDEVISKLMDEGIIPDPINLREPWNMAIEEVFREAKVDLALLDVLPIKGARQGRHSEAMGHILAQLQFMQKTYPGCQW